MQARTPILLPVILPMRRSGGVSGGARMGRAELDRDRCQAQDGSGGGLAVTRVLWGDAPLPDDDCKRPESCAASVHLVRVIAPTKWGIQSGGNEIGKILAIARIL